MPREKEDFVYALFKEEGVYLNKQEVKEFSKVNKVHLRSVARKIFRKRKVKKEVLEYTVSVPIDRRIAGMLWGIWKTASSKYKYIQSERTYHLEIKGKFLWAINGLAKLMYRILDEQKEQKEQETKKREID